MISARPRVTGRSRLGKRQFFLYRHLSTASLYRTGRHTQSLPEGGDKMRRRGVPGTVCDFGNGEHSGRAKDTTTPS
jgi:hypothetical protein